MAIEILTDASERHSWYEHPLTVELRKELEEKMEDILEAWKGGGYVIAHSPEASHSLNLAGLSNYQILFNIQEFMKDITVEVREEEEETDDGAPY